MRIALFIVLMTVSSFATAKAADQAKTVPTDNSASVILNFTSWKEQQILHAQNKVLRLSAKLYEINHGRVPKTDEAATQEVENLKLSPSEKITKTEESPRQHVERQLKGAEENLEIAKELSLDDYISVYLPKIAKNPELFQKLKDQLSRQELSQLLSAMVQKSQSEEASALHQSEEYASGVAVVPALTH